MHEELKESERERKQATWGGGNCLKKAKQDAGEKREKEGEVVAKEGHDEGGGGHEVVEGKEKEESEWEWTAY